MIRLFIAVAFLLNFQTATAAEIQWHDWSAATLQKAQQEDKLILLNMSATWCGFCKKMKATTYKDADVLSEIEKNYIAVYADEAEYPELVKRFPKVGRPGTIILNADDEVIIYKNGYLKPQWMLWLLQAVVQQVAAVPKPAEQGTI
ncbi:DUF255 domain-containing protein [Candidatus Albibeggiatoa sp. nov. BB20]|uniref:thioredoxin family protein n=1 Tax=Candidatus Albibeggiatoa sp. nov. BB20 TaxID=3162723 RepID=UPI0033656361